jgi:cytidylate kinase
MDPLTQAVDAIVLDSTELGVDEVVTRLVGLLRERQGGGEAE